MCEGGEGQTVCVCLVQMPAWPPDDLDSLYNDKERAQTVALELILPRPN